jgi:hypothetical protein
MKVEVGLLDLQSASAKKDASKKQAFKYLTEAWRKCKIGDYYVYVLIGRAKP